MWTLLPVRPAAALNDQNCVDFPSQAAAEQHLRSDPTDPDNLDTNRNGIACEGSPGPFDRDVVRRPPAARTVEPAPPDAQSGTPASDKVPTDIEEGAPGQPAGSSNPTATPGGAPAPSLDGLDPVSAAVVAAETGQPAPRMPTAAELAAAGYAGTPAEFEQMLASRRAEASRVSRRGPAAANGLERGTDGETAIAVGNDVIADRDAAAWSATMVVAGAALGAVLLLAVVNRRRRRPFGLHDGLQPVHFR